MNGMKKKKKRKKKMEIGHKRIDKRKWMIFRLLLISFEAIEFTSRPHDCHSMMNIPEQ